MYPFSDLCNRYLCIYILFTKTGCRICGIILAPCLSVIYLCISKHTNTGIAPTRLTCNSFVLLAIRCLTPTCPTQRMRTSATTGRWSLASIPSSESAVSTNTPFASLHHHEILCPRFGKENGERHAPSHAVATPKYKIDAHLILLAIMESCECRPLPTNGRTWRRVSHIAHYKSFLLLFWGRTRRIGVKREAPRKLVRDRGRRQGAREDGISAAVRSPRRTK